ncbi:MULTISPECIES: hypothetical protein [unclassified Bacillus (in: firmicutes)]|uniref:hypothetical protein n=1 Tax=unclassified Bacillus (in: firmicutes) TaxID=185979 RepID=UPI000408504A|nr:hypothetical protein [Bacillus sp. NSP9.1]
MKMNEKKKAIQEKYREEMKRQRRGKEDEKTYTIEVVIIVGIIVLAIVLNLAIKEF